jgi:Fe-S-cluster-containing dehydrogenase component
MDIPKSYYGYLQNYWEKEVHPLQGGETFFQSFWNKALHDGIVNIESNKDFIKLPSYQMEENSIAKAAEAIAKDYATTGDFEFVLYEKAGIGNGTQANNPWLQELPDPISKVTWDNYLAMSPKQMKEMGFNTIQGQEEKADLADVTINGISMRLPVLASPGQAYGSAAIALGYGRQKAGKAANNIGVNAYAFCTANKTNINYSALTGNISGSVGKYHLASTQTHHTMMGRSIVKETTLADYINDPQSGNPPVVIAVKDGKEHINKPAKELSLWQAHEANGHIWNLSIDLNSCIGCGSCVVSCQAENNVPVVGKDEVRRGREMHWLRIDRYYSSDAPKSDLLGMEVPSENPQVVYQPVMCQHCNHAPCETVCPVIATSHSTDGLNQMIYNRCVGTRYCANNCPYKVRRFNWFNYSENAEFDFNMNDDLGKMVLNPDVVVRSRGVMEKCSMCVQKIQDGKLTAKKENRKLQDGEIQTACSQSCPTKAITFGDINLKGSEIAKLKEDERKYYLLEEVGVKPNVFYLTKVRNVEKRQKA